MLTTVGSVYLVEVAPPHKSGLIGSMAQFGTVAGICFTYYCGMILTWYETAELLMILSGLVLVATFYLPESPVWLSKRGQYQAAIRELAWLRGDVSFLMNILHDCINNTPYMLLCYNVIGFQVMRVLKSSKSPLTSSSNSHDSCNLGVFHIVISCITFRKCAYFVK